jgi:hypothetical protein
MIHKTLKLYIVMGLHVYFDTCIYCVMPQHRLTISIPSNIDPFLMIETFKTLSSRFFVLFCFV